MRITGNNRDWLAETGSHGTAHTTIQSSRTAESVVDRKEAVSAEILPPVFNVPGLCRQKRSLGWILGLRSLHPKNPFPAAGVPRAGARESSAEMRASSSFQTYCGFNPS